MFIFITYKDQTNIILTVVSDWLLNQSLPVYLFFVFSFLLIMYFLKTKKSKKCGRFILKCILTHRKTKEILKTTKLSETGFGLFVFFDSKKAIEEAF